MPRNGSGGYALPEAAFIPNTAISSAAMNSDLSDIGDALTGSLARDGQGGMTAVLPLANTGFTYLTDPNTGIRRTAADTQAISAGAVDTLVVTSTGASVTGTLNVSGAVTGNGFSVLPIGLGPLPWSGTNPPAKWVIANGQTLLRATYPDFWAFAAIEIAAGNLLYTNGNGSTTFTIPSMNGRVPAGNDQGSGILTAATMTPNAVTLGAIGGTQTKTLLTANLPAYTPAGSLSVLSTENVAVSNAAYTSTTAGAGAASLTIQVASGTVHAITSTGTLTGTAQGGTSTAVLNVQPTIIVNYIIYAGV